MKQFSPKGAHTGFWKGFLLSCFASCGAAFVAAVQLTAEFFHHTSYVLASVFLVTVLFSNVLAKLGIFYIRTYGK